MERKVCEALKKNKVEFFLPLNKIISFKGDRSKINFKILFPSYAFVNANIPQVNVIKQIEGVVNFVYWLNEIVAVKNEDIVLMKEFITGNFNIKVEKIPVNVREPASIIKEPNFYEKKNTFQTKEDSVKALFPSIGYALCAKTESSQQHDAIPIYPSLASAYSSIGRK